ncbi:hypothetical protein [Pontibacter pamirensis]|uniref:hypothetical protein n=1 Tax=Pontibacter pamirensis TaxID=2562824 RepID=UPI001389FFB4|nr:hypothetical protein [Pontibacter pamirensis]
MRAILKAKHWQLFLIIMFLSFTGSISIDDSSTLEAVLDTLFLIAIVSFPLILGNELYEYVPDNVKLNYVLFLVTGVLVLLIVGVALVFGDGKHYEFSGLEALPIHFIILAYLYVAAFPVKELKSIELGREAKFGEYSKELVLMLVWWPIGIWFIQPRVNKAIREVDSRLKK